MMLCCKQLSSGESNTDSPTAVLSFVFFLIFLGLRQQAFVICAKILAVGCAAVFAELLFVKSSKTTQEIPVGIFKGFSAELAESSLHKTYRGFNSPLLKAFSEEIIAEIRNACVLLPSVAIVYVKKES